MGKNMKTMDGNTAAAYVAMRPMWLVFIRSLRRLSWPIVDEWSATAERIFWPAGGVVEMHRRPERQGRAWFLTAGALTTTLQHPGLLLAIPNLYKIAGELLPGVFHERQGSGQYALSIFGDHSDVMACRQTGPRSGQAVSGSTDPAL